VSTTHLLILTSNSEFFQPESDNNPITPSSFLPRRQSEYGCNKVRPLNLDNAAMFIQDSGLTVREIEFNDLLQTFDSTSINDFADDVLSQFDDSAVFVGDSKRIEQFGVFIDHSSGNAALYHSNRHQKIFGWVPWETNGYFWSVDEVDDRLFFVTKRTIDGVTKWFLEELSDSFTTDCSAVVTKSGSTFGSAAHLLNTQVRAINTEKTMEFGIFTLDASGDFTLDTDLASSLNVGLFFAPTIVPVRIVGSAGGGSFSAKRKRLVRSILVLKDTFDIAIDGKTLQLRQVDDDPSLAPSALNGTFDVYHLGWDRFGQRTITQTSALPMTLLALSREIAV